jgi:hypothetical protein
MSGSECVQVGLQPARREWANGLHLMVGGAAGLTKERERGLLRLMLGYEFE